MECQPRVLNAAQLAKDFGPLHKLPSQTGHLHEKQKSSRKNDHVIPANREKENHRLKSAGW